MLVVRIIAKQIRGVQQLRTKQAAADVLDKCAWVARQTLTIQMRGMQQVQTPLRKRGSRAGGLLHELHQGGVLTHLFIPKERVYQALQIRAHGCQEIPMGLQPVLDVLTKGVSGCEQLSFQWEPLRVLHIRDVSPQMCEVGCQDQGIGAIGGHRNSKGNTPKQKEDPEKTPKSALRHDH